MMESTSQLQSTGKDICILDKSEYLTRKRKRRLKKQLTGASEHESSEVKRKDDDGYYFECTVCDVGGDLLCCEFFPRVYHLECLSPPLKRTPPGQWSCPFCREISGVSRGIVHTQDSKPRIKSTTQVGESSAHVTGQKLKGQKRWENFHKEKIAQDLDIKTLKKRKRDEDTEKPGKRVNLKLSKPFIPSQVKCKQCGAGIHSFGKSPSALFCRDCVELRKLNDVTVSPTKMSVPAKKDMVPTRHSKLKAGKCDVCQEDGYVILCDSCPRGYHKECLNPPRKRAPKGVWVCPKCGPLRHVKEAKETREAREARAAAKAAEAEKAVKPVKEKEANVEVRQERPPEPVLPSPTTLEVERILGCRVTQGSDTSRRKHKESDVNGKSEPVTEAESGQLSEGKSGERHKIEIRIPIFRSEEAERERGIQEQAKSPLQVTEPKTVAGAQGSCSNDKGRVGVSAEANGDRVAAELSTACILDIDLEKVISVEVSSAAEKGSPERKTVPLGAGAAKQCSSHTQVRPECSLVDAKGEEEEGKPSVGQLPVEKSGGTSEQTHLISRDNNNSSGESKGLERALRVKEGVGNAERTSLSVEPACSSKSSSGMDTLAAAELRTRRVDPDYPGTESPRKPESPSAHLQSTEKPDPCEFLVKWVGKSHIHNEWISEELLRQIAKRKLDNYKGMYGSVPKVVMKDLWLRPQRVLAKRASKKNGDEVFVKWCGLSYKDCTWELASEPALEGIEELVHAHKMFERAALDNCSSSVTKDTNDGNSLSLRTQRPSQVETLAEQPTYLKGGSLFPHQLEALNWLRKCWHRQRNVILADEMGLGKTISATSFLAAVHHEFKARAPCLVLVPLSTMPNWLAEFSQWAPSLNVIEYHGSAKARNIIREHEWHPIASDGSKLRQAYKFNVMFTTYEMVIQDSTVLKAVPWEVLVVDEGHRLKNSESKLFTILNTFSFFHRVLLTGTPLQNNYAEMFNLLNFLQPDKFPSLAAWEEKFSGLSTAEQLEELKKLVAPNMLRRLKKDAMQKIPLKTEIVVPVDMNSVQSEAALCRGVSYHERNGEKPKEPSSEFKSKPPDVPLEFSQKIFGAEKGQSSGVTSTGGEALSGLGIKQGPLPLSSLLPLDSSSLKNQTSENTSALPGSSLQPVTESRSPSLSMALGLGGFASTNHDRSKEASPAADARNFLEMDVQAPVLPSSSASLRSGAGVDLHDLNNLGRVESMPIELDDDNDHQPAVNARGFLSPAKVDGAGRGWQFEEKRKHKQDIDRSWTDDEVDALWIGVRRHGRGNWAAMLLDSKLCFSKSRSVGGLAERWKAEEMNKLSKPEDVSENAKQPAHRWADTICPNGCLIDFPANPQDQPSVSSQRTVRTGVTKIPKVPTEVEVDRNTSALGSTPIGGVHLEDLGTSAPGSAPTGGIRLEYPTFPEFGQKVGDIVSQKLEASLGPLFAEAKTGATLERQVIKLTAKLQDSECLRTDLNNQVAALKAELLECAEKSALEEARMKKRRKKKKKEKKAQATISGLKMDLKIVTEDVHSRAKDQENLKVIMKTLTRQVEVLKDISVTNEAKLREENSVLQQQLQSQRSAVDRYKEELQAEMKKVADLDEEVHSLKDQIENHKFTTEKAEQVQAALRTELNQVKTKLHMFHIYGR